MAFLEVSAQTYVMFSGFSLRWCASSTFGMDPTGIESSHLSDLCHMQRVMTARLLQSNNASASNADINININIYIYILCIV